VFNEIVKLIFPETAWDYKIQSKIDEKGILLEITPNSKSVGLLVGKKGRNAMFLRKIMRRWAIFHQCVVSLKIDISSNVQTS
jgi:predicted RNA-binding protein YlqC (UPF0109 family)